MTRFEYCAVKDCKNMVSKVCSICKKRLCLSHYVKHDCIDNDNNAIYGTKGKKVTK